MNSLERRVAALEGGTKGPGIVCILKRDGEDAEALLSAWEVDNGPLGERTPVFVNLVDAGL